MYALLRSGESAAAQIWARSAAPKASQCPLMPKVVRCASTDLCADALPPVSAGDHPDVRAKTPDQSVVAKQTFGWMSADALR